MPAPSAPSHTPIVQADIDHPAGVLECALAYLSAGIAISLCVLQTVERGTPRAPGAMMVVNELGDTHGYLSGGCVDGDIAARSVALLKKPVMTIVRYGEGSPYKDIVLPCGGALEIALIPVIPGSANHQVLSIVLSGLQSRRAIGFSVDANGLLAIAMTPRTGQAGSRFVAALTPPLQIRVAGRGPDLEAFIHLLSGTAIGVEVYSPDDVPLRFSDNEESENIRWHRLVHERNIPPCKDDPWTAFILLFHDRDWEIPLIRNAIEGDAFYIGAVGSRRTHQMRCDGLRAAGLEEGDIARINGPIGLVPAMRSASMIAISALAEIVDVFYNGGIVGRDG